MGTFDEYVRQRVRSEGKWTMTYHLGKAPHCGASFSVLNASTQCVLLKGHPLPHRDADGYTWESPDGPCTARHDIDEPCMLVQGHSGQHVGFYGRRWSTPPDPPKPIYCHARYQNDEPCILGHQHAGEHFGANGTHWFSPHDP